MDARYQRALEKLLYRDARQRKAKEIRICRRYLLRAKRLGLTEKSATIGGWKLTLNSWRTATDMEVQKRFYEMPSDNQQAESGI